MSEKRDIEEDLKFSPKDGIYQGVKGGLSAIPFIGGPVTNIIANILPSPLEKRKTKWFTSFDQRLQRLEKTDERFKTEALIENENFISTFIYVSNIAIRTHYEKKLEALRNAVVNSVLLSDIDESQQLMFLNLVDRYTPWHLFLLQFFVNPREYGKDHNIKYPEFSIGGLDTIIELTFSDLKGREKFYIQIIKELISDGLMQPGEYYQGGMSEQGMFASRISDMGRQFLQFISESPRK